ncbi:MAG: hypothetical protein M3Q68_08560 [Actinomycetota bacterium]|nr:hypothetical protein [Actinomycetota bacterium]
MSGDSWGSPLEGHALDHVTTSGGYGQKRYVCECREVGMAMASREEAEGQHHHHVHGMRFVLASRAGRPGVER